MESIDPTIQSLLASLRKDYDRSYEVVVVDDGSRDGTWERAVVLAEQAPELRVVRHRANGGKGAALRTAFGQAQGEIVCFLDCGLDLPPDQVVRFVRALEAGSYDVLVGSKRHPGSQLRYPLGRRLMSLAYSLFVRALLRLPLRDTQTGIKVFDRRVLNEALPLCSVNRYAFDAELLVLAYLLGYQLGELPIRADFGETQKSGVNAREIMRMFLDTLKVFYRLRIVGAYSLPRSATTREA